MQVRPRVAEIAGMNWEPAAISVSGGDWHPLRPMQFIAADITPADIVGTTRASGRQSFQARSFARRRRGPVSARACRDMSAHGSPCPARRLGMSRMVNRSARKPRASSSSH